MPDKKVISCSINVSKIDKDRLHSGKKGFWADVVLIPTPSSEYGDYMVVQDTPKGEDNIILGNGKELSPNAPEDGEVQEKDDLPF